MSEAAAARPPHAPERGWAWRLLGSFHVTGIFWYRFHGWIIRTVPEPLLGLVARVFVVFFYLSLRRIRKAIAGNLDAALGPCGFFERERRIVRTLWSFGWCLNERTERLTTTRPFRIQVDGMALWNETARPSQGLVLVTAHIGNYEIGSMLPAQREHRQVHVVREPEVDAEAQAFVKRVLEGAASSRFTTHFQTGDPALGLELLEALRGGGIVAVQGDRPRSGTQTIAATLFGRPFPLPAGPAALARLGDVPLLPVFVFREGRRSYRVVFRPPIRVERSADRGADLARAMSRVAAEIEWAIRREPNQWFCFRRLWA